MDWPASINLEQMTVHASSYGGPIALIKDFKQFLKLSGTASTKPVIRIFNCSGKHISSINVSIFLCTNRSLIIYRH